MKVIKYSKKIDVENIVLVMGSFSTFHIGHLNLLEEAKKHKRPVAVLLFDKPEKLPNKNKKVLEQLEVRLQKIANLNIDYAIVMKTDQKTILTKADDFIKQLKKIYNPSLIVCGKDFRFGNKAMGDVDLLKKTFNINIINLKKINGKKISSTLIQEEIEFGKLKFSNSLLIEPWSTKVKMIINNEFKLDNNQIVPHPGIYLIKVEIDGIIYHGVAASHRNKKLKITLLNNHKKLENKELIIHWIEELKISIKDGDDIVEQKHLKQANHFFKNSL